MQIFFAHELSPEDVNKVAISAGKKFLYEIDRLLQGDQSFIIETTLSRKILLKKIKEAQQRGFLIRLIFLWMSSEELCNFRVKSRVSLGGHNILYEDIIRRYKRGLTNFIQYFETVDECSVYFSNENPLLVFSKSKEGKTKIINKRLYELFQQSLERHKGLSSLTFNPKKIFLNFMHQNLRFPRLIQLNRINLLFNLINFFKKICP